MSRKAAHSDVILERMMSLHPKIIDLTLGRVHRLLDALGNPEQNLPPVIHIAGTNGKGSTLAMIRAGLEGAGQSCHAYTSPHLVRFHERIMLAGSLISEDELQLILEECEQANDGIDITYFEITTCAALLAFSRKRADFTLLEVGLGGRLDATNVVDAPAMTVITPVDLDHQQYLGETIEEIAAEKAGILKRNCFAVVGKQNEAALDVIETQAAKVGATVKAYGQHWHVGTENGRLVYQDEMGLLDLELPNLVGTHQIENAGTALAALRYLNVDADYDSCVGKAEWRARMQKLKAGPLVEAADGCEVWLDGGHNPAAGRMLLQSLQSMNERPLHLITGMLNTKDIDGYLRPLAEIAQNLHAVTIPNEAATLDADEIKSIAESIGLKAKSTKSVLGAVKSIAKSDPNARILICGSLYLAGHVLQDNN